MEYIFYFLGRSLILILVKIFTEFVYCLYWLRTFNYNGYYIRLLLLAIDPIAFDALDSGLNVSEAEEKRHMNIS